MRECINYNNYDFAMYVDASGDDGFKFDGGSSKCFTVACFLCKTADIAYNVDVLNEIKATLDRTPEDELKYSRARRHKNFPQALHMLPKLKGNFSIHNVFKPHLYEDKIYDLIKENTKTIAAFSHTFPMQLLCENKKLKGKSICIVIDRMKEIEMKYVEESFDEQSFQSHRLANAYNIAFRDSKSTYHCLIQIADFVSGLFREFFEESFYTSQEQYSFLLRCTKCRFNQCASKQSKILKKHIRRNIHFVENNVEFGTRSIIIIPVKYRERYLRFIMCDIKRT